MKPKSYFDNFKLYEEADDDLLEDNSIIEINEGLNKGTLFLSSKKIK